MPAFCHVRLSALNGRGLGGIVAPVDLYYGEEDYVSPDISIFTPEQHRQLVDAQRIGIPPLLVVEVLSKSSITWDREDKRGFYRRFGMQEHWVVDPFAETIEVIDLTTDASMGMDPAVSRVLPGLTVA